MNDPHFPIAKKQSLDWGELRAYLLEIQRAGFDVARHQSDPVFFIHVDDEWTIRISVGEKAQVQLDRAGNVMKFTNADAVPAVVRIVKEYGKMAGVDLSMAAPAATPATNLNRLASLLTGQCIVAIFDPYLDNRSLQFLGDILSLTEDASIADNVRLLSSEKVSGGKLPRLTSTYGGAWLFERDIPSGEIRVLPAAAVEHRRFFLLGSGRVVILGFSLNRIDINEAAHVEDDRGDGKFFDQQWGQATALI